MSDNQFCIIMAGGVGSRFWPLSTPEKPKQFLDVLGTGRTLLQQTFDRFRKIMPASNIFIVSNEIYDSIIQEQIPEISTSQILLEPCMRNTAPCVAYASYKIHNINPDANIIVAPSDHLILNEQNFLNLVKEGFKFINKENLLLTLGIKPTRPETGFGYIQVKEKNENHFKKVKTFTEKPNLEMARIFYESGDFYWNAGIFMWSLKTILKAFKEYLPEVNHLFEQGTDKYGTEKEKDFIQKTYHECINISLDYGIMEKAKNVYVLESDFGWSDLGTWGSLYDHLEKDDHQNAIIGGDVHIYDSNNCLVHVPNNKRYVIQGLQDFIVVESKDSVLIFKRTEEHLLKKVLEEIKNK